MTVTREPACRTKGCPAPRDPDWHQCWCGTKEIEHHHVESRGMGGSKLKRNVVALCHKHHEAVTLHECYDIVTVFDWGTTYTYTSAKGEVLHDRKLEAGSAAAEGASPETTVRQGPTKECRSSAAAPSASGESSAAEDSAVNDSLDGSGSDGVRSGISASSSAAPPSLESWCREGMQLVHMGLALRDAQDGFRFAIGDWFNKGEGLLGEEAFGYLRGFEEVTVRQYSWVAGRVSPDTRVFAPSWSHCRAVAALPEPEQKERLKRAQTENLSSKDLNQAINPPPPKVKRWSLEELREIGRAHV